MLARVGVPWTFQKRFSMLLSLSIPNAKVGESVHISSWKGVSHGDASQTPRTEPTDPLLPATYSGLQPRNGVHSAIHCS